MWEKLTRLLSLSVEKGNWIALIVALTAIFIFYFLPSLLATFRLRTHLKKFIAINLVLGWSMIAWCGLMVWAFTGGEIPESLKGILSKRENRTRKK